MMQTVQNFLAEFVESSVYITVGQPETITEKGKLMGSTTYTAYQMAVKGFHEYIADPTYNQVPATEGGLFFIRRRYSDFEAIRQTLRMRYNHMGVVVVGLPPKKIVGNADKHHLLERARGLSIFCQEIMTSPWLSNDNDWIEFCGGKRKGENIGYKMLLAALALVEVPPSPLARIVRLKEECKIVDVHLQALLCSTRVMQASYKSLVTAKMDILEYTQSWQRLLN